MSHVIQPRRKTIKCPNSCCTLKVEPYTILSHPHDRSRKRRKKAGAFIYDPNTDKVLLIQSRGNLWGLPKGTLLWDESERECAMREVKEETGLDITLDDFPRAVRVDNRAIYYYVEMDERVVQIQSQIQSNDANGIGWIRPACLEQCIRNGTISVNRHCRIVFEQFQGCILSTSDFILVTRKKRHRSC